MQPGRVSSAALLASGLAGVAIPDRFAAALGLAATSPRGRAETRAGLGGTFVALGAFGVLSSSPAARVAVGVTWLGAAAVRMIALRLDEPSTDWTYWAYLALEVGLGAAAVGGARTHGSARS